jgi:hypothetical protein
MLAKIDDPYFNLLCNTRFSHLQKVPLYIQASEFDSLLDDAVALARIWEGPIKLDIVEDMTHAFLSFIGWSLEAKGLRPEHRTNSGSIEALRPTFQLRCFFKTFLSGRPFSASLREQEDHFLSRKCPTPFALSLFSFGHSSLSLSLSLNHCITQSLLINASFSNSNGGAAFKGMTASSKNWVAKEEAARLVVDWWSKSLYFI